METKSAIRSADGVRADYPRLEGSAGAADSGEEYKFGRSSPRSQTYSPWDVLRAYDASVAWGAMCYDWAEKRCRYGVPEHDHNHPALF